VDKVAGTAISTLFLYIILWIVGALCSLDIRASAFFSLAQILMLWQDIGDADKTNRLLQHFTGAVVNGGVGWLVGDHLAYAGGVIVGLMIFAKVVEWL